MKVIEYFNPKTLDAGIESVVGACNGYTKEQRFQIETPLFAKAILRHVSSEVPSRILDYGCGVGRIAKEVLRQNPQTSVTGVDPSEGELKLAREYVNDSRFSTSHPEKLTQGNFDVVYCVYVLQHVPALYLREALARMHYLLKDGGTFVFCSSLYRMAIGPKGFWDDRESNFVDLMAEIKRFFVPAGELFTEDDFAQNEILRKMVRGEGNSLAHPAFVFKKAAITGPSFNGLEQGRAIEAPPASLPIRSDKSPAKRLILRNRQSPGDVLVMTAALRSLHLAHKGKFLTDVDSPCPAIFQNNPYVTALNGDGEVIDMHYPEIHKSGMSGRHFTDGHRKYLEEVLGIRIPQTGLLPELYLDQNEQLWPSPLVDEIGEDLRYWVINAGIKSDFTLKGYHRYQEVVDIVSKFVPVVQIGDLSHDHKKLEGVIDMRGKTHDMRRLFRLIHKADGVLTCVSFPMHIAAALRKPCVVVAGGREGTRWELYPSHRFLYTNGTCLAAAYDGCWKSKVSECMFLENTEHGKVARCMELIRPEDVARAVELYYLGGMLEPVEIDQVCRA
jgi:2-polyprenyl-3-methyl-5-hydroxy-6-metoxy-1,4-benzoquinol methylase/ADP-heptose:LPS heptosyltransferase